MHVINYSLFVIFILGTGNSFSQENSLEDSFQNEFNGKRALIITTSQKYLDKWDEETGEMKASKKRTGVYAAEMTEPYYVFSDAGLAVDVASIKGGEIPIEKMSLRWYLRTPSDKRFRKDSTLQDKVTHSLLLDSVSVSNYDIIFMSGGWGAAYDFVQSDTLGAKITEAYADQKVLGSVCHGSLGFIGAKKTDGSPLVEGVKMTGVTNKQLKQLGISRTPKHPETELREAGAVYSCNKKAIEIFADLVVVDEKHLIVSGQNQKGGVETAEKMLELLRQQINAEQE